VNGRTSERKQRESGMLFPRVHIAIKEKYIKFAAGSEWPQDMK
jgi:hypothetical protein